MMCNQELTNYNRRWLRILCNRLKSKVHYCTSPIVAHIEEGVTDVSVCPLDVHTSSYVLVTKV